MSATQILLDKVKEKCGLKSDAALARQFKITPSAVSNYRQGTRHPEPELIEMFAQAINESPIAWALQVQAEREERINPKRAKVWLRWSKAVAGIAASAATTYLVLRHTDVQTLTAFAVSPVYIMRNCGCWPSCSPQPCR